ncbi:unnamed protein product [Gongylonema pulchrum]|uniref:Uncharacterized protein n=1 Tax=Gongylonema pulchrum TaxID=637853 RepID=A0A183EJM0_9BILA|nr:unnamed protein product [Gongylonema pulchrum]
MHEEEKFKKLPKTNYGICNLQSLNGRTALNAQLVEEVAKLTATNDDLRSELTATQQKWSKDKDNLLHKARQEEKVSRTLGCFAVLHQT